MKTDNYKRKNGLDMPKLHTVPSFAHYIGKSERWVRQACEDDVILAKQKVGSWWVIAEDTLFRPRALRGMSGELLDIGLPDEKIIGKTYVVPAPEYKGIRGNPEGNNHPKDKVILQGWPRIKRGMGVGREKIYKKTGVHPETQKKLERYEPVTSAVVWKLVYSLGIEVEDLLRP